MECFHICTKMLSESNEHPDIEYLNVLKNLEADIKTASTVSEKEKIFDDFVYNYTVIPEIWDVIIYQRHFYEFVNISKYFKQSIPDLYLHICVFNSKSIVNGYDSERKRILFGKVYEYLRDCDISQEYFLKFPHSQLEKEFKKCDECSNIPISKDMLQKYEKAKTCAEKLLNNNLSNEEWIKILFEWDDPKFAIQKIESKLTTQIWNKNLWKAYMDAMKTRNLKVLLNIYHRYTRLFLSDIQMTQKYESIKKNICKNDEFQNLQELESFLYDDIPQKIQNCSFLNIFKHVERQYYDLPKTIIQYIVKCSKASLRLKLFKSCKSIFLLNSTPICHQLRISPDFKASKYLLQSLQIRGVNENDLNALSNLYVTNRLEIKNSSIETLQQIIVPRLSKCDVRFIFICQQIISKKEFEFLVDPSRVEQFYFDNGGITNTDGTVVNVRYILERLSTAYSVGISFNQKYDLPAVGLSGLNRAVKIQSMGLKHFSTLLSPGDYCNFILENASLEAKFYLGFGDNVTTEHANAFNKAVHTFTVSNFSKNFINDFEIGYYKKYEAVNLSNIIHRKQGRLW